MQSRIFTGVFGLVSVGCGVVLGANLNESQRVHLPRVFASSVVRHEPKTGSVLPLSVGKNNVGEIMKHGFPSYDNIRTFDDFVMSYDRRNKNPNWVFEHLTKEKVAKVSGVSRQQSEFKEDETIHEYFRSTNIDFKKSGYDRGHLAAAGNHRWSQKALDDTFHLSNISPQVGKGFNRDGWNTLESCVRHLTKEYTNVYVCTGPLYLPRRESDGKIYVKYEVIGKNHVSVPTHFFKVVLCETQQKQYDLLSFVMPNQELPEKLDVHNYLVPIESIERAAGFRLFDKLPKNSFRKINGKAQ